MAMTHRRRRALILTACCLASSAAGFAGSRAAAPPEPEPAVAGAPAAGCACLPAPVLPVTLRASRGNAGWKLFFHVPPYSAFTEVFARFDDHPEESTGHEVELDLMTGKPEARLWVVLPDAWVTPGEHTVAVRMVRRDGTVEGPHTLRFHPGDQLLADAKYAFDSFGDRLVAFAEHSDLYTWLMLTHLFGMEESLREIRYSIDDCSLRERIVIGAPAGPDDSEAPSPGRPYVTLPRSTRSACAQVVFRDGTTSEVLRLERRPG
jgi:hypothetical protein